MMFDRNRSRHEPRPVDPTWRWLYYVAVLTLVLLLAWVLGLADLSIERAA